MMKCLATLVTLAVMLVEGNGLQCYDCRNVVLNGELQDESISCDSSTLKTCDEDQNACATMTLRWDSTSFGVRTQKTGLYYSCSLNTIEEADACRFDMGADECSMEYCMSERCNSGPTFSSGSNDHSSDDNVDDSSDDSVDDSSDDDETSDGSDDGGEDDPGTTIFFS